jgi:hypothetical protein
MIPHIRPAKKQKHNGGIKSSIVIRFKHQHIAVNNGLKYIKSIEKTQAPLLD